MEMLLQIYDLNMYSFDNLLNYNLRFSIYIS